MESQKSRSVGKKRKQPGQEAVFFADLVGTPVTVEDLRGHKFGGKLLYVGPYSLILEKRGMKILHWKHALSNMRSASASKNGKGHEPIESLGLGSSRQQAKNEG